MPARCPDRLHTMSSARACRRLSLGALPWLIVGLLFSVTSGTAGGSSKADYSGMSGSLTALLSRAEKLGVGSAPSGNTGTRGGDQAGTLRDRVARMAALYSKLMSMRSRTAALRNRMRSLPAASPVPVPVPGRSLPAVTQWVDTKMHDVQYTHNSVAGAHVRSAAISPAPTPALFRLIDYDALRRHEGLPLDVPAVRLALRLELVPNVAQPRPEQLFKTFSSTQKGPQTTTSAGSAHAAGGGEAMIRDGLMRLLCPGALPGPKCHWHHGQAISKLRCRQKPELVSIGPTCSVASAAASAAAVAALAGGHIHTTDPGNFCLHIMVVCSMLIEMGRCDPSANNQAKALPGLLASALNTHYSEPIDNTTATAVGAFQAAGLVATTSAALAVLPELSLCHDHTSAPSPAPTPKGAPAPAPQPLPPPTLSEASARLHAALQRIGKGAFRRVAEEGSGMAPMGIARCHWTRLESAAASYSYKDSDGKLINGGAATDAGGTTGGALVVPDWCGFEHYGWRHRRELHAPTVPPSREDIIASLAARAKDRAAARLAEVSIQATKAIEDAATAAQNLRVAGLSGDWGSRIINMTAMMHDTNALVSPALRKQTNRALLLREAAQKAQRHVHAAKVKQQHAYRMAAHALDIAARARRAALRAKSWAGVVPAAYTYSSSKGAWVPATDSKGAVTTTEVIRARADFNDALLISERLQRHSHEPTSTWALRAGWVGWRLRFWWRVAVRGQGSESEGAGSKMSLQRRVSSVRCGAQGGECPLPCTCLGTGADSKISWGVQLARAQAKAQELKHAGDRVGKGFVCVADAVNKAPCTRSAWHTLWHVPADRMHATATLGPITASKNLQGNDDRSSSNVTEGKGHTWVRLQNQLGWRAAEVTLFPASVARTASDTQADMPQSFILGDATSDVAAQNLLQFRFVLSPPKKHYVASAVESGSTHPTVELGPLALVPPPPPSPVATVAPTPLPELNANDNGFGADVGAGATAPDDESESVQYKRNGGGAGLEDLHFPSAPLRPVEPKQQTISSDKIVVGARSRKPLAQVETVETIRGPLSSSTKQPTHDTAVRPKRNFSGFSGSSRGNNDGGGRSQFILLRGRHGNCNPEAARLGHLCNVWDVQLAQFACHMTKHCVYFAWAGANAGLFSHCVWFCAAIPDKLVEQASSNSMKAEWVSGVIKAHAASFVLSSGVIQGTSDQPTTTSAPATSESMVTIALQAARAAVATETHSKAKARAAALARASKRRKDVDKMSVLAAASASIAAAEARAQAQENMRASTAIATASALANRGLSEGTTAQVAAGFSHLLHGSAHANIGVALEHILHAVSHFPDKSSHVGRALVLQRLAALAAISARAKKLQQLRKQEAIASSSTQKTLQHGHSGVLNWLHGIFSGSGIAHKTTPVPTPAPTENMHMRLVATRLAHLAAAEKLVLERLEHARASQVARAHAARAREARAREARVTEIMQHQPRAVSAQISPAHAVQGHGTPAPVAQGERARQDSAAAASIGSTPLKWSPPTLKQEQAVTITLPESASDTAFVGVPRSEQSNVQAMATDEDFLFVASSAAVVQLDKNTLAAVGTTGSGSHHGITAIVAERPSAVKGTPGVLGDAGGVGDGGHVYVASQNAQGVYEVLKLLKASPMNEADNAVSRDGAQMLSQLGFGPDMSGLRDARIRAQTRARAIAEAAGDDTAQLLPVNMHAFRFSWEVPYAMVQDDTSIYCAMGASSRAGRIDSGRAASVVELRKSDLSRVGEISLSSEAAHRHETEFDARWIVADNNANVLYVVSNTQPARVARVLKSALRNARQDSNAPSSGDSSDFDLPVGQRRRLLSADLLSQEPDAALRSAAFYRAGSGVHQLTLREGEDHALSAALTPDGGLLFIATNTAPAIIVRVRIQKDISPVMVHEGAITLGEGQNYVVSLVADAWRLYAATYTTPAMVVELDHGDGINEASVAAHNDKSPRVVRVLVLDDSSTGPMKPYALRRGTIPHLASSLVSWGSTRAAAGADSADASTSVALDGTHASAGVGALGARGDDAQHRAARAEATARLQASDLRLFVGMDTDPGVVVKISGVLWWTKAPSPAPTPQPPTPPTASPTPLTKAYPTALPTRAPTQTPPPTPNVGPYGLRPKHLKKVQIAPGAATTTLPVSITTTLPATKNTSSWELKGTIEGRGQLIMGKGKSACPRNKYFVKELGWCNACPHGKFSKPGWTVCLDGKYTQALSQAKAKAKRKADVDARKNKLCPGGKCCASGKYMVFALHFCNMCPRGKFSKAGWNYCCPTTSKSRMRCKSPFAAIKANKALLHQNTR